MHKSSNGLPTFVLLLCVTAERRGGEEGKDQGGLKQVAPPNLPQVIYPCGYPWPTMSMVRGKECFLAEAGIRVLSVLCGERVYSVCIEHDECVPLLLARVGPHCTSETG